MQNTFLAAPAAGYTENIGFGDSKMDFAEDAIFFVSLTKYVKNTGINNVWTSHTTSWIVIRKGIQSEIMGTVSTTTTWSTYQ